MGARPSAKPSEEIERKLMYSDDSDAQAGLESGSNPLITHSKLGARTRMSIFLIVAVLAAVAHDRFYAFLDGRPADGGIFTSIRTELGAPFSDQSIVNILANIISKISGASFAAVVACAFVQIFWKRLTVRATSLLDIAGITSLAQNPLDVTSWTAIRAMRSPAVVIVVAALMQLVSIITPGALTVASVTSDERCPYDIVDLHTENSTTVQSHPRLPTSSLVARTLLSGTYIPPSRLCQACEYDVTFIAPAVQCRNVTQSTNHSALTGLDTVYPKQGADILGMWASYPITSPVVTPPDETDYSLWIFSRNFPSDPPHGMPASKDCPIVVLKCSGWVAEYQVHVAHGTFSTATVTNLTMQRSLTSNDSDSSYFTPPVPESQVAGFWVSFIDTLTANISMSFTNGDISNADTTWDELGADNRWLSWSIFGRGSNTMPWQWPWPSDLQVTVPAVMQNISLSLLAGTDAGFSIVARNTTDCRVTSLQYVYSRARLLGTYGTGLALAVGCLLLGLHARRSSPRSESLDFMRILAAYPLGEQLRIDDSVIVGVDGVLRRRSGEVGGA